MFDKKVFKDFNVMLDKKLEEPYNSIWLFEDRYLVVSDRFRLLMFDTSLKKLDTFTNIDTKKVKFYNKNMKQIIIEKPVPDINNFLENIRKGEKKELPKLTDLSQLHLYFRDIYSSIRFIDTKTLMIYSKFKYNFDFAYYYTSDYTITLLGAFSLFSFTTSEEIQGSGK